MFKQCLKNTYEHFPYLYTLQKDISTFSMTKKLFKNEYD